MNRPPPPSQTRLLSRFRSAFFATPGCALLTLLSLAVLWLMAESLTRWLIIDAVFGGEDREACASGGSHIPPRTLKPASRGNSKENAAPENQNASGGKSANNNKDGNNIAKPRPVFSRRLCAR